MSTKRKADGHSKAASSRPGIKKSGEFQTEAERDSGFSDASSEHMSTMDTTDSEDSPCTSVKQGPQTPSLGPQSSKSGSQTPQLAVVGGSYSSLSPMIIMNNVLLKQPGDNPPALKPWGFSPTVEVVQPVVQQPQVVFIHSVSRQAASRDSPSRHRRSKKYLPILKSYPKIAPHPGDSSSSSGRGTGSSSSSCSTSSFSGSEKSNQQDHSQKDKQQRSLCNGISTSSTLPVTPSTASPMLQNQISLPTTETTSIGSALSRDNPVTAARSSELTPSSFNPSTKNQTLPHQPAPSQETTLAGDLDSDNDADTRRKRFCNTYNILSKSGLLDITLRTKELLRQNRRTQSDLERLKEHADLFLQALHSGDTSICLKLQASLQEEDKEKERERASQAEAKTD